MERVFSVTCRRCAKSFPVDYDLRHMDVQLECPHCREKFLVEEAAAIDERWG